jgi:phosphoribosylformylglycinamidine synthase
MWQLSQAIDGISEACEALATPVTGGNVSLYNETLGEGIYPTPVLGIVGILEDVHKAAFPHFREAGRAIVLLCGSEPGDAVDAECEFGSSEYAKEILGEVWGFPPSLELAREAALQKAVIEIVQAGLAESVHDCSDGGVAVTLAESSFANGTGFKVNLNSRGLPPEFVVFGEDASRVVISCDPAKLSGIVRIAAGHGIAAEPIGETVSEQAEIAVDGVVVVSGKVSELRDRFEGAIERVLDSDPEPVLAN